MTNYMTNPLIDRFVLCRYSENEEGEVILFKVEDDLSDKQAKDRAFELFKNEPSSRFVMLTEFRKPTDSSLSS